MALTDAIGKYGYILSLCNCFFYWTSKILNETVNQ